MLILCMTVFIVVSLASLQLARRGVDRSTARYRQMNCAAAIAVSSVAGVVLFMLSSIGGAVIGW